MANLCLAQTNVLTYHNDNFRTGQNVTEKILTPANVKYATFGKLFTLSVDGKVDAQPLYVSSLPIPNRGTHNIVFAATEHDSVYAFDADSGATYYWHVSMLKGGETPSDARGCGQVTPEIGVTATPVIDLTAGAHGTIYVVSMSKDFNGYYQRLHALDITTGAEQFGGPVNIQATYPGVGDGSINGTVVFDPKQYKSRPGLLLVNGVVYTSWSSHCDIRPYTGWTIGYDRLTLQQTSVFNFAPNGNEASIWSSGAGPAADAQGNLFFSVANGTFDTTLNAQGLPGKGDYGNAFVMLNQNRLNGNLQVADYWTMYNTGSESNIDEDLGSGGLLLLPDVLDGGWKVRHLGVGAGKDRNIYVVDRDNMGHFNAANNSNLYQELPNALGGGEFAMPAWFNGTVYFGAVGDFIRAFSVGSGKLSVSPTSSTGHAFGYPGTTPAISANGTSNAILWAAENTNPAVLHAYDATQLSTEFYNTNQAPSGRDLLGAGNKFITPTIANGKVFVGTTNSVGVFGLLPKATEYVFETESLPHSTSGASLQRLSWSGFPDGVGTKLAATAIGNSVTFTLNVPAEGNYDVRVSAKELNTRGIFQLSVNSNHVGFAQDEYARSETFREYSLGTVSIAAAGGAAFKFTVTGKNAASSGYSLSFDYIKLTPQ
ncbi:MAG: pyrrolo-quinoline quinone [Acidobacteriota bacterium]|nr:pyrrolo-quinoline quinone [Acidobacteriota bacterium]